MNIVDPLSVQGKKAHISTVLDHLCSQENCDGEPYDQMTQAAEYIRDLEKSVDILYRLARLARNTDGLFPSTHGSQVAQLLIQLRGLDEVRYNNEVMGDKKE